MPDYPGRFFLMNFRSYIDETSHTGSRLPDFLRHNTEDRDDLNHGLNNNVHHSGGRPEMYVLFKTHEKGFHSTKQVDKSILISAYILDSLRDMDQTNAAVGKGSYSLGEECRFR